MQTHSFELFLFFAHWLGSLTKHQNLTLIGRTDEYSLTDSVHVSFSLIECQLFVEVTFMSDDSFRFLGTAERESLCNFFVSFIFNLLYTKYKTYFPLVIISTAAESNLKINQSQRKKKIIKKHTLQVINVSCLSIA